MAKHKTLDKLLREQGKQPTDTIKWEYYGYGFFSCAGEQKVKDLHPSVKYAKCFKVTDDGTYLVDGAL